MCSKRNQCGCICTQVQCVFCGGRLHCWSEGDEPEHEHAIYFPHCAFVRTSTDLNDSHSNNVVTAYVPVALHGFETWRSSSYADPELDMSQFITARNVREPGVDDAGHVGRFVPIRLG
jgi:hypothetical protein